MYFLQSAASVSPYVAIALFVITIMTAKRYTTVRIIVAMVTITVIYSALAIDTINGVGTTVWWLFHVNVPRNVDTLFMEVFFFSIAILGVFMTAAVLATMQWTRLEYFGFEPDGFVLSLIGMLVATGASMVAMTAEMMTTMYGTVGDPSHVVPELISFATQTVLMLGIPLVLILIALRTIMMVVSSWIEEIVETKWNRFLQTRRAHQAAKNLNQVNDGQVTNTDDSDDSDREELMPKPNKK